MSCGTFFIVTCFILINSSFSARTFDKETSKIRDDLRRIHDAEQQDTLIDWLARERIERDEEVGKLYKKIGKHKAEKITGTTFVKKMFASGTRLYPNLKFHKVLPRHSIYEDQRKIIQSMIVPNDNNSNSLGYNKKYVHGYIDKELRAETRATVNTKNESKVVADVRIAVSSKFNPQVLADARVIVDSKFDPKVVASILPYRSQQQCAEINSAIAELNSGKPLVDSEYVPLASTYPYDDLLFALVNDPMTIFSMYLGHYLDAKDVPYIIMLFIQIDDRVGFKQIYDSQHSRCFDDVCYDQKNPFAKALHVWAQDNRVDNPSAFFPDRSDLCEFGEWLWDEINPWNHRDINRTGLESMLMKHTIKYAQRGIECYEIFDEYTGDNLIYDITIKIKDKDLVNLYTSLVYYIKNDNDYLARILHDHCDGTDNFSLWIVVLTTRRTRGAIEALDQAFQAAYEGVSMKDFVLKFDWQDTVFKDMLAALL